ncbi:MAG: DUF1566 domain-containing protein [Alteromonas sp.]|nr:DUF1566 domain-containing protein [Alteromonas sp.]
MNNKIINASLGAVMLFSACFVNVAIAGLIDRGNGMIYDDAQNITWLQNANLAGARMNWDTSVAWADNLDFGGFSDWRLPTINISTQDGRCDHSRTGGTDCGLNVLTANSELAYMFYENLGNVGYYDTNGNREQTGYDSLNTSFIDALTGDTVSFIDLNRTVYWSGTEYAPVTDSAWNFDTRLGSQGGRSKNSNSYAWAVRDGDIGAVDATVTEPSTLAILGLGLLGLITRKRQG